MPQTDTPGDRLVRGEYRSLPDPVTDRLFSVIMALSAEVWTLRDRLRLLESALDQQGIGVDAYIDSNVDSEGQLAAMRSDRDAFVGRVLQTLTPNGLLHTD